MAAMRVGFVGWRGMVGSVLMKRMLDVGDFAHLDPVFFSTSGSGTPPAIGRPVPALRDVFDARVKVHVVVRRREREPRHPGIAGARRGRAAQRRNEGEPRGDPARATPPCLRPQGRTQRSS